MKTSELLYYNDYGGFTKDGKEYVIKTLEKVTPMPWTHMIANCDFGTIVTSRAEEDTSGVRIVGTTRLRHGRTTLLKTMFQKC